MDKIDKIVAGIIDYLKTSRQLDNLSLVIEKLREKERQISGENTAIVTSAYPLKNGQLAEIEKRLFVMFKRRLEIVNRVDKEIIGGLVIQVSDKVIDLSLENYLDKIEENINDEN